MSYVLPIDNNVVRPSTSKGYENGKIPTTVLKQIPNVETTCVADPTAARAFEACFAEAKIKIPGLRIKDVGDYRTFLSQYNLFVDQGPNTDGRYIPVSKSTYDSTPAEHRKIWAQAGQYGFNSIYWVKNKAKFGYWPATAATPGSSNHGWGLALDVAEEYDSDSAPDPITEKFIQFLCVRGPYYGIYASLKSEPWHWQYVSGDVIPAAVLAYEANKRKRQIVIDKFTILDPPDRFYDSRDFDDKKPIGPGVTKFGVKKYDGINFPKAVEVTVTVSPQRVEEGDGYAGVGSDRDSFVNWKQADIGRWIPQTIWFPVDEEGMIAVYTQDTIHILLSCRAFA